jgi:UDP-N-acetylmuramate dehydrogenase
MASDFQSLDIRTLQDLFGARLQRNAPLSRYTAARLGGPADVLLTAGSADELAEIVTRLWALEAPFTILGGGSNVLVSDAGVRGIVVISRNPPGTGIRFVEQADPPTVWAEAGVNFGALARQAARRGLAGLEWAVGIPGTLGGAVVGNAGAHGGDMAGSLRVAEILHRPQAERVSWPVERLDYGYRTSLLKRQPGQAVMLGAELLLAHSTPDAVQAKMDEFTEQRRRTQPPGASLGSMFKNPPGDYAGRLIDAAGLKGARFGDAEISPLHGNFFINRGQATAADLWALIDLAQKTVAEKFGVMLELEIALVGEWKEEVENNG